MCKYVLLKCTIRCFPGSHRILHLLLLSGSGTFLGAPRQAHQQRLPSSATPSPPAVTNLPPTHPRLRDCACSGRVMQMQSPRCRLPSAESARRFPKQHTTYKKDHHRAEGLGPPSPLWPQSLRDEPGVLALTSRVSPSLHLAGTTIKHPLMKPWPLSSVWRRGRQGSGGA